jgi:predicted ATPase
MIKRIKVENFFSFGRETEIILDSTNILVGINGSGKSNLLKAIKLLYEGVVGKEGFEKIFLRDWSGFSSVGNFSLTRAETIKITFEFDRLAISRIIGREGFVFRSNPIYEIEVHKSGSTDYYFSETVYSLNTKSSHTEPFVFLKVQNGRGVISTRQKGGSIGLQHFPENEGSISFKPEELVLRQLSDPTRFYPLFTLKTAIEKIFVYEYFDTTFRSPIRALSSYNIEKNLLPNGENLVQILQRIKNHHSLAYEKIEALLTNINPMFKDIGFDNIGAKSLLVLRERSLTRTVSVEHISDGTLRFLLLLSILYNPEKSGIICLDEPEIGLHPDMINTVAQAIKHAAAEGNQLIIATHSPLLLNAFDLEDILIFEKNKNNETIINSKSEEDFEEWEGDFLVGQLWLTGKLGGVRWQ